MTHRIAVLLAGACLWSASPHTLAAESYDNCTGFVDSVPATIATQGTWCLRRDLSTAMASGAAITIVANNVTLDCNDFKVGGLAAGDGTTARGIRVDDRVNATVRNCTVRGFHTGIDIVGSGNTNELGSGHVVEDNRLDENTFSGIRVLGYASVVRRNVVNLTGGSTATDQPPVAIETFEGMDIMDNLVHVVRSRAGTTIGVIGIKASANGERIGVSGNRIDGLRRDSGGDRVYGIRVTGTGPRLVEDNQVDVQAYGAASGIACSYEGGQYARGNVLSGAPGFLVAIDTCTDAGGNL